MQKFVLFLLINWLFVKVRHTNFFWFLVFTTGKRELLAEWIFSGREKIITNFKNCLTNFWSDRQSIFLAFLFMDIWLTFLDRYLFYLNGTSMWVALVFFRRITKRLEGFRSENQNRSLWFSSILVGGGQWEIVCFDFTSENLGSPDFWIRSIECDPYFCSRLFVFTVLTDIFWSKYIRDRVNGIKFFHCSKNFFKLKRKYLYITKIKRITWTAELIAGLMDRTNNSQEH